MGRIRLALIYGGRSSEHAISVLSAGSVLAAVDPDRYDVVTIGITRGGRWIATAAGAPQLQAVGRELPEVAASADLESFGASSGLAALADCDVVFPLLHGPYGEDGTIQGLLEMAGIPYVGSGVLASAAGMDKSFTKLVLAAAGLQVTPWLESTPGNEPSAQALAQLGMPLFVKPARGGSSVGISKVRHPDELVAAVELARRHDDKVLVESAIAGREIECGVLQDADGTLTASLPAEIRLRPDFDWYDFDAKYLDDATEFDIPPVLPPDTIDTIQNTAVRAFQALGCAGLARVDFFLTGDKKLVINEINTMPGFTSISMYPKMFQASGVSYSDLINRLVATALA